MVNNCCEMSVAYYSASEMKLLDKIVSVSRQLLLLIPFFIGAHFGVFREQPCCSHQDVLLETAEENIIVLFRLTVSKCVRCSSMGKS